MKKQVLFMVVLLAAVGLLAGFAASSALANSGYTQPCGPLPRHGGAGPGRDCRYRTTERLPPTVTRPLHASNGRCSRERRHVHRTARDFESRVGRQYRHERYLHRARGSHVHRLRRLGRRVWRHAWRPSQRQPRGATNYTITASCRRQWHDHPGGAQTVASGGSRSSRSHARADYNIADVLVDGISAGAVATYQFTNVTANHTIAASFAQDAPLSYTITTTAGANGAITPAGPQTVDPGKDLTFTITPSDRLLRRHAQDRRDRRCAGQVVHVHERAGEPHHRGDLRGYADPVHRHDEHRRWVRRQCLVPIFPFYTLIPTRSITYYFVPGGRLPHRLGPGQRLARHCWIDDDSYTIQRASTRNTTVAVKFLANT